MRAYETVVKQGFASYYARILLYALQKEHATSFFTVLDDMDGASYFT